MPDGSLAAPPTAEKPRHSRPRRIVDAEPRTIPHNVSGFSIELLGRQLALSEHRYHMVSILSSEIGRENKGPDMVMDAATLRQRHAEHAETASSNHNYALQELIMNSRPVTLADVVVQLLVTHSWTDRLDRSEDGDKVAEIVERVIAQAAHCIARHAGLRMADVGGASFADSSCDRWPDVDISRVADDMPRAWRTAMDGTVPEWDR